MNIKLLLLYNPIIMTFSVLGYISMAVQSCIENPNSSLNRWVFPLLNPPYHRFEVGMSKAFYLNIPKNTRIAWTIFIEMIIVLFSLYFIFYFRGDHLLDKFISKIFPSELKNYENFYFNQSLLAYLWNCISGGLMAFCGGALYFLSIRFFIAFPLLFVFYFMSPFIENSRWFIRKTEKRLLEKQTRENNIKELNKLGKRVGNLVTSFTTAKKQNDFQDKFYGELAKTDNEFNDYHVDTILNENMNNETAYNIAISEDFFCSDKYIERAMENPNSLFAYGLARNSQLAITKELEDFAVSHYDTFFARGLVSNLNFHLSQRHFKLAFDCPDSYFAQGLEERNDYNYWKDVFFVVSRSKMVNADN